MIPEKFEKILADYLEEPRDEAHVEALTAALQTGELEAAQVASLLQFDNQLRALPVPEPGPALQTNFYLMLAREKEKQAPQAAWYQEAWHWLRAWHQPDLVGRLAYSLVLLALGMALGLWYNQQQNQEAEKISALTNQVQQLQKMMMLTLLEQPSATDRLKAVNLTVDMDTADSRVIMALLQTLNQDPSVNVRLAAIEALYQHAGNPLARQGLVQAIARQESPLVQLALADIMLAMQEKESVNQLRKLLQKKGLHEDVKVKVKQTIQVLI